MQKKALAPEISTWPEDNPQLIGSKCANCSAVVFPSQERCPHCSAGGMNEVKLPPDAAPWSRGPRRASRPAPPLYRPDR